MREMYLLYFSGLHTMFYLNSQVYKWREEETGETLCVGKVFTSMSGLLFGQTPPGGERESIAFCLLLGLYFSNSLPLYLRMFSACGSVSSCYLIGSSTKTTFPVVSSWARVVF